MARLAPSSSFLSFSQYLSYHCCAWDDPAVSVPSNIVEGCSRESSADYTRFLEIAFGSIRELEYQITLSQRLGYLPETNEIHPKVIECSKVLGALVRSLRKPTA
ncbi:MAG: four helix bundle protein [Pirellulaceae bacterium]|nr:four helix bundle protein [Pirellulaceae bacterium]